MSRRLSHAVQDAGSSRADTDSQQKPANSFKGGSGRKSFGTAFNRGGGGGNASGALQSLVGANGAGGISGMFGMVAKLSAENKINTKNTWALTLIDHMAAVVEVDIEEDGDDDNAAASSSSSAAAKAGAAPKKGMKEAKGKGKGFTSGSSDSDDDDDAPPAAAKAKKAPSAAASADMLNFTKASVALDASIKIYSCRVDDVYSTSYRVLENLSRSKSSGGGGYDDDDDGDDDDDEEGEDGDGKPKQRSGRRRGGAGQAGGAVGASTLELRNKHSLCLSDGTVEAAPEVDPVFLQLSSGYDEQGLQGLLMAQLQALVTPHYPANTTSSTTASSSNSSLMVANGLGVGIAFDSLEGSGSSGSEGGAAAWADDAPGSGYDLSGLYVSQSSHSHSVGFKGDRLHFNTTTASIKGGSSDADSKLALAAVSSYNAITKGLAELQDDATIDDDGLDPLLLSSMPSSLSISSSAPQLYASLVTHSTALGLTLPVGATTTTSAAGSGKEALVPSLALAPSCAAFTPLPGMQQVDLSTAEAARAATSATAKATSAAAAAEQAAAAAAAAAEASSLAQQLAESVSAAIAHQAKRDEQIAAANAAAAAEGAAAGAGDASIDFSASPGLELDNDGYGDYDNDGGDDNDDGFGSSASSSSSSAKGGAGGKAGGSGAAAMATLSAEELAALAAAAASAASGQSLSDSASAAVASLQTLSLASSSSSAKGGFLKKAAAAASAHWRFNKQGEEGDAAAAAALLEKGKKKAAAAKKAAAGAKGGKTKNGQIDFTTVAGATPASAFAKASIVAASLAKGGKKVAVASLGIGASTVLNLHTEASVAEANASNRAAPVPIPVTVQGGLDSECQSFASLQRISQAAVVTTTDPATRRTTHRYVPSPSLTIPLTAWPADVIGGTLRPIYPLQHAKNPALAESRLLMQSSCAPNAFFRRPTSSSSSTSSSSDDKFTVNGAAKRRRSSMMPQQGAAAASSSSSSAMSFPGDFIQLPSSSSNSSSSSAAAGYGDDMAGSSNGAGAGDGNAFAYGDDGDDHEDPSGGVMMGLPMGGDGEVEVGGGYIDDMMPSSSSSSDGWGQPVEPTQEVHQQQQQVVDLLPAARKAQRMRIGYETTSKRVDVAALKHAMRALVQRLHAEGLMDASTHAQVERGYRVSAEQGEIGGGFADISGEGASAPSSFSTAAAAASSSSADAASAAGAAAGSKAPSVTFTSLIKQLMQIQGLPPDSLLSGTGGQGSVTVPFYFITALHLANENGLTLTPPTQAAALAKAAAAAAKSRSRGGAVAAAEATTAGQWCEPLCDFGVGVLTGAKGVFNSISTGNGTAGKPGEHGEESEH